MLRIWELIILKQMGCEGGVTVLCTLYTGAYIHLFQNPTWFHNILTVNPVELNTAYVNYTIVEE